MKVGRMGLSEDVERVKAMREHRGEGFLALTIALARPSKVAPSASPRIARKLDCYVRGQEARRSSATVRLEGCRRVGL